MSYRYCRDCGKLLTDDEVRYDGENMQPYQLGYVSESPRYVCCYCGSDNLDYDVLVEECASCGCIDAAANMYYDEEKDEYICSDCHSMGFDDISIK